MRLEFTLGNLSGFGLGAVLSYAVGPPTDFWQIALCVVAPVTLWIVVLTAARRARRHG